MDRRRFVLAAIGAGPSTVATPWLGAAAAATEDDLAFANFGASTELLVRDFSAKAIDAKLVSGHATGALKHGRSAVMATGLALPAALDIESASDAIERYLG